MAATGVDCTGSVGPGRGAAAAGGIVDDPEPAPPETRQLRRCCRPRR
ncbi:hypothetical protein I552_8292 [Mycobacterium xenopi 3993]|nr:hypothetical protein I552_8292 [Mycobacterium xenopi 3993]